MVSVAQSTFSQFAVDVLHRVYHDWPVRSHTSPFGDSLVLTLVLTDHRARMIVVSFATYKVFQHRDLYKKGILFSRAGRV